MKQVRITVIRKANYPDLSARYELQQETPCELEEGQVFISHAGECPANFCRTAWETLAPFAKELAQGGGNFYGNWMRNPHSALLSCNDGFRPVSFLLEAMEEEDAK